MAKQRQYRQGDVLVQPIASIPAKAKLAKPKGRIVLAEGEATGHCHAIAATKKVQCLMDGPQMYLRVREPVELLHDEHGPITVEPGEYMVRRQVEQWLDEVRQVAD